MTSPLGRPAVKESIPPKLEVVSFETPDSGGITFDTSEHGTLDSQTSGLVTAQQKLPHRIIPKTVAPKVRGIQGEREKMAKDKNIFSQLLDSAGSSNSGEGTTIGDTTMGNIILDLDRNAEDMSSSEIRKNSGGLLANPSEDDDVFTTSSAQGKNINWIEKYKQRVILYGNSSGVQKTPESSPEGIGAAGIENETPTRGPRFKKPPKRILGIQFPNFGRFWGAKYNLEEEGCASVVKMFAQCNPEDSDRVEELYDLAWLIKVSTAMIQCDIEDQARVQELVRWARDIRIKNDWQSPVPLGWNLKQQEYIGPLPSDEERQQFVDYAWLMNYNKVGMTWDPKKKDNYSKAAAVVHAFKEKYPDFPHDYPPGYPGEHPNRLDGASGVVFRRTSDYRKLPKTKKSEGEGEDEDNLTEEIQMPKKRKRKVDEMEVVIKAPKKKSKVTIEKGIPVKNIKLKATDKERLRRSGRIRKKDTVN